MVSVPLASCNRQYFRIAKVVHVVHVKVGFNGVVNRLIGTLIAIPRDSVRELASIARYLPVYVQKQCAHWWSLSLWSDRITQKKPTKTSRAAQLEVKGW